MPWKASGTEERALWHDRDSTVVIVLPSPSLTVLGTWLRAR